jgi:Transcriptional regulator
MEFQRARNEEQKNTRRDQIIEAALKLYNKEPIEKITFASIAKELNFSRANLYKYVTTKEEIFLWILTSDIENWGNQVHEVFEKYDALDLKTFSRLWAEQMYKNERLLKLLCNLSSVLKDNITIKSLESFKKGFYSSFDRLNFIIKKFFPQLSNDHISLFIQYQIYYAMGLYPSSMASQSQRSEFRTAGLLSGNTRNFILELATYLEVVIIGLQSTDL